MARPVVMLPQEDRSLMRYELGAASSFEPAKEPDAKKEPGGDK